MTKHTPGPWGIDLLGTTMRIVDSENNDIALMPGYVFENKATAQLIASAPELLETVKFVLDCIERGEHYFCSETNRKQLQQAITKAEEVSN